MESTPEQTAEGKAVVTVLAAVLERLVKSNAQSVDPNGSGPEVTKFHALKAPGISIKQYLERVSVKQCKERHRIVFKFILNTNVKYLILPLSESCFENLTNLCLRSHFDPQIHKYASCSTECFVLALIYIDRLIQNNNFVLSELNVHRVVITAILLAAKFFDDAYYNNAYYAKVGGVLVSEMNGLEVEFLFRINFSLHVKPEVFVKYQDELVSHAVGAGLEQQMPCQPQTIAQQHFGMSGIVTGPETTQQHQQTHQDVNVVPQVMPSFMQQITHTQPVPTSGNVTPSPPQNTDYCHNQQELPQVIHHIHKVQYSKPQQEEQIHPNITTREESAQNPLNYFIHQQQHSQPIEETKRAHTVQEKNYQTQNNRNVNVTLNQTKDILYATCCPYGGRLNPGTTSPSLFNTTTRIYQ